MIRCVRQRQSEAETRDYANRKESRQREKGEEKEQSRLKQFLPPFPTFPSLFFVQYFVSCKGTNAGLEVHLPNTKSCKKKKKKKDKVLLSFILYRPGDRAGRLERAPLPLESTSWHHFYDQPWVKVSADMAEWSHNQSWVRWSEIKKGFWLNNKWCSKLNIL